MEKLRQPNFSEFESPEKARLSESASEIPTAKSPDPLENPRFEWKPPDLSPNGDWAHDRIANQRKASTSYTNSDEVFIDGLQRLEHHRNNWTPEGPEPKRLQLLWWEFPPEHWEELRLGAQQNFLQAPEPQIRPNAPMDAEMTKAAVAFVDELMELKVMR